MTLIPERKTTFIRVMLICQHQEPFLIGKCLPYKEINPFNRLVTFSVTQVGHFRCK